MFEAGYPFAKRLLNLGYKVGPTPTSVVLMNKIAGTKVLVQPQHIEGFVL